MIPKSKKPIRNSPLRVERLRLGLRQKDVSDETGICVATISQVENGLVTPTPAVARKLYTFFNGAVPMVSIYDAHWYLDYYLPGFDQAPQAKAKEA